MKKIGGMFYYEPCKVAENGYFERVCPPGGDLAFTMSAAAVCITAWKIYVARHAQGRIYSYVHLRNCS